MLPLRTALKPTPEISRSLLNPSVTPITMPAIMERAVPYMALAKRVLSAGATVMFPSANVKVAALLKVLASFPLGPSTESV